MQGAAGTPRDVDEHATHDGFGREVRAFGNICCAARECAGYGIGGSFQPSNRRAITCACISAAPSKMFRIRESQRIRLIPYSSANPLPP